MRNMTMKRIRTALCLILAAALLAGCAFLPSDSEPETPAPTDRSPALLSSGRASVRWPWPLRTALPPPRSGAFPRHRWCWKPSLRWVRPLSSASSIRRWPRPRRSGRWPPVRTSTGGCWWASSHSGTAGRGTVRPELPRLLFHPGRGCSGGRAHRLRLRQ